MKGTILLVEDEAALVDSLKTEFQFDGYKVYTAGDGLTAVAEFEKMEAEIDIVILDWMLPKLDGLGVLRRIRNISATPVILLTARSYASDKVSGLKSGADDYVTKPFDIEELLARIEAVMRRSHKQSPNRFILGDLLLDQGTHQVMVGSEPVQLSQREYNLLLTFFKHAGEVCSRDDLLDWTWGVDFAGQPNTVDVTVRHIRQKLDKAHPERFIKTVRGIGYQLVGK